MIIVIKHVAIEGPGSIGEFFRNTDRRLEVISLHKGEILPQDLEDVEAIISLGGPMNVYEQDKYPFLKEEEEFLKQALKEEIPILGICLGAQALAKACGARVKAAEHKEIGWHKVNLTGEGRQDPIFGNLAREFSVFQWHQDTFEISKEGKLLASSDSCVNQAFRFGKNAYGLQFHVEVTAQMIESWINEYINPKDRGVGVKDMLIEAYKNNEMFRRQANLIYLNFSRIISESKKINAG